MQSIDIYQYQPTEKRADPGKTSHHDRYAEVIPGDIRMLVLDENTKLANEISEY